MSEEYQDPTFKQWILQPESLIAISAVILSVCGLVVSFYEASLIREYQRASVWPHVEIGPSFDSFDSDTTASIGLHVQNTGIGPARVKAAKLIYKGEKLKGWDELFIKTKLAKKLRDNQIKEVNIYQSFINEGVIPPTKRNEFIFRISFLDNSHDIKNIYHAFGQTVMTGNINIVVCYCSVYDECWISKMFDEGERNKPQVESCENIESSNI